MLKRFAARLCRGLCKGGFKSQLTHQLLHQANGVALLTLLPFMIMGLIFNPFHVGITTDLIAATPYSYTVTAASFIVGLALATLIVNRQAVFMVSVLSAFLLLIMALKHAGGYTRVPGVSLDWQTLYTLYTFTALLTFPVIALKATVSNWLFRSIVLLLLLDMILAFFLPSLVVFRPLFIAYFPAKMSVVLCLLLLAFLRMLWKFHTENAAVREQINKVHPKFLRKVRFKTLALWWPMLLVFVACTIGYQLMHQKYINQPLVAHLNSLESKALNPKAIPTTVEYAVSGAINRLSDKQNTLIQARINKQLKAAKGQKTMVYKAVADSMPKRFPGTKTTRCGLLNFSCYVQNGIKSMVNNAYISARNNMLSELKAELDALERTGNGNAKSYKAAVDQFFKSFAKQSNRSIQNTATGLRYASWVALIYGVLILSKSMMIVFARVFYARLAIAPAQSAEVMSQTAKANGHIQAAGHQYTLTPEDGFSKYYLNFKVCGNNVVDRRRIPQPFTLLLKRLWSQNYAMCKVDLEESLDASNKSTGTCDIIVDPPSQIVIWDLAPGEEIFVDLKSVIGFSADCRMSLTISLSLGSLIFGRAIYYSIKGPTNTQNVESATTKNATKNGRVFIKTTSTPITGSDAGINNIMQSSSLVAWQRRTPFNVISALTKSDIFFSGYSIRKANASPHSVIYDTSQKRRVGTGQGVLKMARAFLLPF